MFLSLPSKSMVLNMNVEHLVLAQQQLAKEVAPKEDTTLYTDETSKFGSKFGLSTAAITSATQRKILCAWYA
jgi:hypothetical protein